HGAGSHAHQRACSATVIPGHSSTPRQAENQRRLRANRAFNRGKRRTLQEHGLCVILQFLPQLTCQFFRVRCHALSAGLRIHTRQNTTFCQSRKQLIQKDSKRNLSCFVGCPFSLPMNLSIFPSWPERKHLAAVCIGHECPSILPEPPCY